jgi:hypothetical protein
MNVDLHFFTYAVAEKHPKHFLELGKAPAWLQRGLFEVSSVNIGVDVSVLLSSDTAEVKIRKHFKKDGLGRLLDVIVFSLTCEALEVHEARYPNAVEVYFVMDEKLWLVVFKCTKMNEIMVSTAHRTDARNLKASRQKNLLHGIHIEI